MDLSFGKSQVLISPKMRKHPLLARWIHALFGYTHVGNYARSQVFKRLLNQIPVQRMQRIMDLGCGSGEFAFMMADAFPHSVVWAVEDDPGRVKIMHEALEAYPLDNLITHQGSIDLLPTTPTWDFIYSINVFDRFHLREMPFSAARERLQPGGYLLVKMPSDRQEAVLPVKDFGVPSHSVGQIYNLETLQKRFKAEGFEVVFAAYSDGKLARLAWELSQLARKAGPVAQLVTLPLCKLFIALDTSFGPKTSGNAIQVIGRKPMTL